MGGAAAGPGLPCGPAPLPQGTAHLASPVARLLASRGGLGVAGGFGEGPPLPPRALWDAPTLPCRLRRRRAAVPAVTCGRALRLVGAGWVVLWGSGFS